MYFVFFHDNIYVCQLRRRGRVLLGGDGDHKVFSIFFVDKTIHLSIPAAGEEGCSLVEMEVIRKKLERREQHSSPSLFAPIFISQTISSSFPFHLFCGCPNV